MKPGLELIQNVREYCEGGDCQTGVAGSFPVGYGYDQQNRTNDEKKTQRTWYALRTRSFVVGSCLVHGAAATISRITTVMIGAVKHHGCCARKKSRCGKGHVAGNFASSEKKACLAGVCVDAAGLKRDLRALLSSPEAGGTTTKPSEKGMGVGVGGRHNRAMGRSSRERTASAVSMYPLWPPRDIFPSDVNSANFAHSSARCLSPSCGGPPSPFWHIFDVHTGRWLQSRFRGSTKRSTCFLPTRRC